MHDRELVETVVEIARLRASLDALEQRVVAELDATHAAAVDGWWASAKDFLTAVTRGSPRRRSLSGAAGS